MFGRETASRLFKRMAAIRRYGKPDRRGQRGSSSAFTVPTPPAAGTLRSCQRARRLRPGVHRAHQGHEKPRDHQPGAADPQEPHAPRGYGRGPTPRRRRGHPHPAAGRLSAPGLRSSGAYLARGGPIWRRHGFSSPGARLAHGVRAGNRARHGKPGPGRARLARRPYRQFRLVRAHQGCRAGDPAGIHRARFERNRPGRDGAQALHHSQAGRPCDPGAAPPARQGILRPVDVDTNGRLQGNAAGQPGRRVLPRSARAEHGVGAGDGAPAVFDQHLSDVGSGASV